MTTLVIWEVKTKPGLGPKAEETFVENCPGTREFPGCQGIEAYRNQNDPENYALVEYWDAFEDYEKYVAWRTETGVLPDFLSICAEAPVLRSFDLIET